MNRLYLYKDGGIRGLIASGITNLTSKEIIEVAKRIEKATTNTNALIYVQ